MTSAEASCRAYGSEATHRTISALDPSMILFNAVVEILAVPLSDIRAKLAANCTRVPVMPVRGYPGLSDASDRFGRSKELLCRGHIASLAQHHVHQSTSTVNRSVQIAPSAVDLNVGFIDIPRVADPTAATPAAAKIVDQRRRQFRLPIANRLVGEFDTADKGHLREIAQAQFVTQSPEHNERDDIGRILGAIQRPTSSFVELLATVAATEPQVAVRGALWPLRNRRSAAGRAFHPPCSRPSSHHASGADLRNRHLGGCWRNRRSPLSWWRTW
jgi:hypothetical protein